VTGDPLIDAALVATMDKLESQAMPCDPVPLVLVCAAYLVVREGRL
jgi:hypothetical protein